jgi:hypothetical protein
MCGATDLLLCHMLDCEDLSQLRFLPPHRSVHILCHVLLVDACAVLLKDPADGASIATNSWGHPMQ